MTEYATDRQTSYIMSLASKIQGDRIAYMSQVRCIHLTQREKTGGMTRSEASMNIEELQRKLRVKTEKDAQEAEETKRVEAAKADEVTFKDAVARVLTAKAAAQFCGVTVPTWRAWVKSGKAPQPHMLDESTPVWDAKALTGLVK